MSKQRKAPSQTETLTEQVERERREGPQTKQGRAWQSLAVEAAAVVRSLRAHYGDDETAYPRHEVMRWYTELRRQLLELDASAVAALPANIADGSEALRQLDTIAAIARQRQGERPSPPALNETDRRAADYIRQNPGAQGEEIAREIGITPGAFRSNTVRKLKAHGFYNQNGYFAPEV